MPDAVVRSPSSVSLAFNIAAVLQRDHVECAEDWEGCSTRDWQVEIVITILEALDQEENEEVGE